MKMSPRNVNLCSKKTGKVLGFVEIFIISVFLRFILRYACDRIRSSDKNAGEWPIGSVVF